MCAAGLKTQFYSYHNLQGSQTHSLEFINLMQFYSYHNLQGSQTGSWRSHKYV